MPRAFCRMYNPLMACNRLVRPGWAAAGLLVWLTAARAETFQQLLDNARAASGAPGASAAIMTNGTLVWQGTSGYFDIASGQPIAEDTLYSLASVTKTFTSTMVLRLYEEGKLGLDDLIAPYVPPYMPSTNQITIRNLLGMTSGYQDVEDDPLIVHWLNDPNHLWTRSQILTRVQPVTFTPGTQYQYVNTNYVILGGIIDNVSALGVGGEFQKSILEPLGLQNDAFFDRVPSAAPFIAHGYNVRAGQLVDTFVGADDLGVPTGIWGTVWTDGGIAASVSGVARFTDALFGGGILQPATLAMMEQPGPDGSYGLGTYQLQFDSHNWQGNDGYFTGFTAVTMYDLSRRLTITVLTNYTDYTARDAAYLIWYRMAAAYDHGLATVN